MADPNCRACGGTGKLRGLAGHADGQPVPAIVPCSCSRRRRRRIVLQLVDEALSKLED